MKTDKLIEELKEREKLAEELFSKENGKPFGDDAVQEFLNEWIQHERQLTIIQERKTQTKEKLKLVSDEIEWGNKIKKYLKKTEKSFIDNHQNILFKKQKKLQEELNKLEEGE